MRAGQIAWPWRVFFAVMLLVASATPAWSAREAIQIDNVTIEFDSDDRSAAQSLAEDLPEAVSEIAVWTGDPGGKIQVHIAKTPKQMADFAPRENGPPDWAGGVAYPARGLIILSLREPSGQKNDLVETLRHELVHVSLHRATGGRDLPRWFHEGVAHLGERTFSWARTETLMWATMRGQLISLAELDRSFPRKADHAQIAYAESYDFVDYLARQKGTVGIRSVIARVSRGVAFDEAMKQVFGNPLEALEEAWIDDLRSRYLWGPLATTGILLWAIGSVLLVIGWRRRRRQNSVRLAEWERQEAAEDAELAAAGLLWTGHVVTPAMESPEQQQAPLQ